MVIISFTGPREGMTDRQKEEVTRILLLWPEERGFSAGFPPVKEAHHGDSVGADSEFHDICRKLRILPALHPSDIPRYRAFRISSIVHDPKPPLLRNRDIVNSGMVLIAALRSVETRRSGTWSTVRYARKRGRKIILVHPDGKVVEE